MKVFKYRNSWRDTFAITALALALLLLTTFIENDRVAVGLGAVALVGGFVALRLTRKPIDR